MTLREWCEEAGPGALSALQRATGLAYTTVLAARDGRRRVTYATAAALSQATDGRVTIAELCEPAQAS